MAEGMTVVVDGTAVQVDPTDIDGLEWRAIKREIDMTSMEVAEQAAKGDFEAVAALVWIVLRRTEPEVEYEAVLGGLSMASFQSEAEAPND